MVRFSLIRPFDQPPGKRRLIEDLKSALQDNRFTDFRLIVAFARSGPLYRLRDLLQKWRKSGKSSAAIFGLSHQGTSKEALELALSLFDCVYVVLDPRITFHPKIYLFKGENYAEAFIGSNNLTVGGTEKNFESAVQLMLEIPLDDAEFNMLELSWSELLPQSCPATIELDLVTLEKLVANNIVVEEKSMRTAASDGDIASVGGALRSELVIVPESPLPKSVIGETQQNFVVARDTAPAYKTELAQVATSTVVRKHVIQIKPHRNGEIFLSVSAVLQNPEFFSWPFKGQTTPKKIGNPSYPQLDPDPIVNITVFGADLEPVLELSSYVLNTVYYSKKSEIRITASPLVDVVPEYSVMIMELSSDEDIDYEIIIHTPDSPEFDAWVAACNQTMPSGGKKPRKYGWL